MYKLTKSARIVEIDHVSDQLIMLYEKTASVKGDAFLKNVFDEMKVLSEQITEAIRRDKAQSDLEDADNARDEIVSQLHYIIMGYVNMPIEALSKSGKALKEVFDKYGIKMTRESFAGESSLIESMLGDFAADALKGDVEALQGIPETLAALRSSQDAFSQAYLAYATAKAEDKAKTSASEIRRSLFDCINNRLVVYLNAMAMSNAATYGEFASVVSEEINKINALVASRNTRAGKADDTTVA